MTLNELAEIDSEFANAIKMLIIKSSIDGATSLSMSDLANMLDRLGFSASGQEAGIRDYIVTLKNRNPDLVADVNDDEIMFSTMPKGSDTEQQSADDVKQMALKQARKKLGL